MKWIYGKLVEFYNFIWFTFVIRCDEFHPSLSLDPDKIMGKSDREVEKYMKNLLYKRQVAHLLDLKRRKGK